MPRRSLAASTLVLLAAPAAGFVPLAGRPPVLKVARVSRPSSLDARSPATAAAEALGPAAASSGRSRASASVAAAAAASFMAAAVLATAVHPAFADFDEGGSDVYSFGKNKHNRRRAAKHPRLAQ